MWFPFTANVTLWSSSPKIRKANFFLFTFGGKRDLNTRTLLLIAIHTKETHFSSGKPVVFTTIDSNLKQCYIFTRWWFSRLPDEYDRTLTISRCWLMSFVSKPHSLANIETNKQFWGTEPQTQTIAFMYGSQSGHLEGIFPDLISRNLRGTHWWNQLS